MKKSFGFGKKNLYLGFAFLVVVGLLSFFIFSGAREGFYTTLSVGTVTPLTNLVATAGTTIDNIAKAARTTGILPGDTSTAGIGTSNGKCVSSSGTYTTTCSQFRTASSCSSGGCKWSAA